LEELNLGSDVASQLYHGTGVQGELPEKFHAPSLIITLKAELPTWDNRERKAVTITVALLHRSASLRPLLLLLQLKKCYCDG